VFFKGFIAKGTEVAKGMEISKETEVAKESLPIVVYLGRIMFDGDVCAVNVRLFYVSSI